MSRQLMVPAADTQLYAVDTALGRSARMSPAESAHVVIEMDAVNGELGPDFAALACPTVFVVGNKAPDTVVAAIEDVIHAQSATAAAPDPCSRSG